MRKNMILAVVSVCIAKLVTTELSPYIGHRVDLYLLAFVSVSLMSMFGLMKIVKKYSLKLWSC